MAFLGSIGKFATTALKSVGRSIAPAIGGALQGLSVGGPKGAIAGAGVGLLGGLVAGKGGPPSIAPGANIFSGLQTFQPQMLAGPVFSPPPTFPQQQPEVIPVAGTSVQISKNVFDAIVAIATRLNIRIRTVGSIVRIGRSIMARLIRFARSTPGMTILSMLTTLGLSVHLANELIAWYSTSGRRRRRIKVTNVKALNRSVRRLEGFRRLSRRVEMALASRGHGSRTLARRRCPKCRKNPCCC